MTLRNIPLLAFFCAAMAASLGASSAPLSPGKPVLLSGTKGGFDFIRIDPDKERLLLGHRGNASFDVFDIASGKLLKVIGGCRCADAAADTKHGKYFASCSDPDRVVIVDAATLEITGEVPLPSAPDLISCDPATGLVHVCDDGAPRQWVVDPVAGKIVATIAFSGGGMEDMAFSPDGKCLYQALKQASSVGVVDLKSNSVSALWSCAPEKGPWGLAFAPGKGLLAACAGKLLLLDAKTGKVTATAPIEERVDEMAYDPGLGIAYCSSRKGILSSISVGPDTMTPLGNVPSQQGSANVTVDPVTHLVWIAYPKGDQSYVQSYSPNH